MMGMAAEPWIRQRLQNRNVFEEGGKWKGNLRGDDVGSFNSQAEAFKAYRQAAFAKFGQHAALPTDEGIDAALAAGPIAVEPQATRTMPRPASKR